MTTPRVSVCIPTYRGANTIGAAMESVLAQSSPDLELVIVDDASPDDTAEVVRRFTDPRVRYIRNESNLGPEGNWNRCLSEARGRYFKLLPHDDVLAPQCLERQAAVLDADAAERLAFVFCAREVIGPDGKRLTRRGYPGGHEGVIDRAKLVRSCVRRGTNLIGEPGAVLMRRSLAQQVGPFNAAQPYVIDLDYWFRLLEFGDAYYCAESLAGFRVSAQQWSVAIGRSQSHDFVEFVSRVSGNRFFDLSAADIVSAKITALLNNVMRLIFYKVYLNRS